MPILQPDAMPTQAKPEEHVAHHEKVLADAKQTPESRKPASSTQQRPVVLLIGDSMCDGLGARFSDYAAKNNFEFHCVIWYGSTAKSWATTRDLKYHIDRVHPTFIIMSLGTNDLGYVDYSRRESWVQDILHQFGDIPYAWIGPLSWSRIRNRTWVDILRRNVGEERFFDSTNTYCARLDGIHPTFPAAARWVDEIARWMNKDESLSCSISFDYPDHKTIFRPDEKHTPKYKGRSL